MPFQQINRICFQDNTFRFWAKSFFLLTFYFFIVRANPAQAQVTGNLAKDQGMRSLTVSDGLPQGWVTQVLQDGQGFIWVASKGLSRYDGIEFKNWQHTEGDTATISNNTIREMHTDDHDNIWLCYYDPLVDVFNTTTGHVRHLATERGFSWIKENYRNGTGIKQEAGRYFFINPECLIEFDESAGKHQEIKIPPHEQLTGIGHDNKGNIWVSTDKTLYVLKGTGLSPVAALQIPPNTGAADWRDTKNKTDYRLNNIVVDRGGNIILPAPAGLFIYDVKTKLATYTGDGRQDDLSSSTTMDSFGKIYTVINASLYMLDERLVLKPVINASSSFWINRTILADGSGVIWMPTGGGAGLRLFNPHVNRFTSRPYKNSFSHDVLEPWLKNSINEHDFSSSGFRTATDSKGGIWATCPGLLSPKGTGNPLSQQVFKLENGTFTAKTFKGYTVNQIAFGGNGQCWAVLQKLNEKAKTLVKANLMNGTFEAFITLPRNDYYDIETNQYLTVIGRKVCVLTQREIRLYDTVTKACTVYPSAKIGAENELLMVVAPAKRPGELWIATQGSGMIRLNISNGEIKHFNKTTGLPDDVVYFIAPDDRGYFWCSSNSGIFRFDPLTGNSPLFTIKDGLQGNEFNRYHFLKTPDGHFVFGGTEGYTTFYPGSIFIDDYQTPVMIPEILIANKSITAVAPNINSLVSSLDKIDLKYNQNFFTLNFAGLEYKQPANLQYRYMLYGIDKSWIKAKSNSASYTFVPPGSYLFKVNATNATGAWSKQVKELLIVVHPPWWQTWWAYSGYAVILFCTGFALYRNWLQKANSKQQLILKDKEAEQLKAVDEMKSRFFTNITHEFRTPLSLILGPANQMLAEEPSPLWKKRADTIERNASQMLRLINQLMDMAKLEANNMQISLFRGDLNVFIAGQAEAFRDAANAKNIRLSSSGEISHHDYLFDADKLHTIVSNLLANAVKFTPGGGNIKLRAQLLEGEGTAGFTVTVKDDGIGIPQDKLPFIFNRFYQVDDNTTRKYQGTGIGLALAKELCGLMNGMLTAVSEPGKGSTFTLTIPVKKAMDEHALFYSAPVITKAPPIGPSAKMPLEDTNAPVILVVEDNDELREFIAQAFSQGYRVLTAGNGAEGLKIAQHELPDIIISDLMMPELNGYDFCRAIKTNATTDHIAFLLLTAKTSKSNIMEGLQNQADDYLVKPFVVAELRLRVDNLINRQNALKTYLTRELKTAPSNAETSNPFLKTLYGFISINLNNPDYTVDMLAADVAMSIRTLNRKLANLIGMPASEVIKQFRLKKAAELLANGWGVAETTYEVGYDSPAYFSTLFKSAYGVVPSEYKNL